MLQYNKNGGGALLTALFIMTLVAIVATAMSTRLQLDIYRTKLIIAHDKLYLASQALTFWSINELNNKKNIFSKTNKQGMVAEYPKELESIYSQVKIRGGLYDLQARFNLNNLVDRKSIPIFLHLLSQVMPDIPSTERVNLAVSLKDWLIPYEIAKGRDIYTAYYLAQKPPYFPSNQLMKSASELRLVKNIDASIYLSLEQFITALPEPTPININTAPQQVLMSLGNGLKEEQVNELIVARGENGIKKMEEINELLKKLDLPKNQITIESQYFLSVSFASTDELNMTLYTFIERTRDRKGKLTVNIIRESVNGF